MSETELRAEDVTVLLAFVTDPASNPEVASRIGEVLAMPELKRKLFDAGIEAGGGTPEAFGRLITAEARKWGEVIKETGAKVD